MKLRTYVYILITVALFTNACKKKNEYLPPNFNYKIDPLNITENVNVGAYFYNYASTDWAKKYSDMPLLGEYNSLTAMVMAQQRNWADSAGVDFFIFNWNGATAGDPLLTSFINGRNNKVKMVINYNTSHLAATNASPLTGAKLTTMINEFKSLVTNRFTKDYYYSLNGQPVILISPLNLPSTASSSIDYTTVIPAVRKSLDSVGIHPYFIGEITSGWLPPVRYAPAIKVMDGVDLTDWSTSVYDRSVFMASFVDQNWKNWTDSTTTWNVDYVPCIFPGFNDKTMTPASALYNIDRSKDFYTDFCNVAKRNMGKKRVVLINSWNDFQKGTALEPAKAFGSTFLNITRSQFKIQ
ncbi:MAG TPA: glycoside hydrolase family 99-like domain-containing protein [Segetibacter sp.]|nr:glycoside hydrolase family 99-like domain-containing protein [Segetibacter sp.]